MNVLDQQYTIEHSIILNNISKLINSHWPGLMDFYDKGKSVDYSSEDPVWDGVWSGWVFNLDVENPNIAESYIQIQRQGGGSSPESLSLTNFEITLWVQKATFEKHAYSIIGTLKFDDTSYVNATIEVKNDINDENVQKAYKYLKRS